MNRIISPQTMAPLLALLLLSGSGLALASEGAVSQPTERPAVQLHAGSEPASAQPAEVIHLAWDRVGTMA